MAEREKLQQIASATGNFNGLQSQPPARYGIYRAICVDPKDPLKSGRIKVNIPAFVTDYSKDNEGIWAYPCTPYAAPNLEKSGEKVSDFGSLLVPPKDSYVFVFFEDGDVSKPRYFGGLTLENAIPTECRNGEQYYNKHMVIKTPEKRMIFVSDDDSHDSSVIIRGKDRS